MALEVSQTPDAANIDSLMETISKMCDTTPGALTLHLLRKRREMLGMVVNNDGLFIVLGVDTFDGDNWVDARFKTRDEALEYITQKTEAKTTARSIEWDLSGKKLAECDEPSARYYAYAPDGEFVSTTN